MYQKEYSIGQEKAVVRSCNEKLEEDIIENHDKGQQGGNFAAKGARSYMSRSDEGEWDELSQAQKRLVKEEIEKTLGKKKVKEVQPKMFTDEIIVSESVSIQEDPDFGENIREQREIFESRGQSWFNIMLVGGEGVGKTTFMQCFLGQYKQKNNAEQIKSHTPQLYTQKVNPKMAEPSLNMTILDTPGYNIRSMESIYEKIRTQIENKMVKYSIDEKKLFSESAIYQKKQRKVVDQRVHCILFFLEGPRLLEADWWMLAKLQKLANIIPIIAKGDMYSLNQIRQFKRIVKEKAVSAQVKWFDAEEYLRQHFPDELGSLKNGIFGSAPPFVIASSIMQVEDGKTLRAGRQFHWGTCIIQDPSHTDFKLLSRLLRKFFKDPLIQLTQIKMKSFFLKNHDSWSGIIKVIGAIGTIAALSLFALKFRGALKNK